MSEPLLPLWVVCEDLNKRVTSLPGVSGPCAYAGSSELAIGHSKKLCTVSDLNCAEYPEYELRDIQDRHDSTCYECNTTEERRVVETVRAADLFCTLSWYKKDFQTIFKVDPHAISTWNCCRFLFGFQLSLITHELKIFQMTCILSANMISFFLISGIIKSLFHLKKQAIW